MRKMQAKPGVDLTVHAGEKTRSIRGGDIVDFDQVLVPARKGGDKTLAAETFEDAIGRHAENFDPVEDLVDEPAPAAVQE